MVHLESRIHCVPSNEPQTPSTIKFFLLPLLVPNVFYKPSNEVSCLRSRQLLPAKKLLDCPILLMTMYLITI